MFEVTLLILDAARPHIPGLTVSDFDVFELPTGIDHDVLIGTDVLLKCRLYMDGPGGYFTLDY